MHIRKKYDISTMSRQESELVCNLAQSKAMYIRLHKATQGIFDYTKQRKAK